MAELDEFRTEQSWRARIKKIIFTERQPHISSSMEHNHRFSLDIVDDLNIIMENTKMPHLREDDRHEKNSCASIFLEANNSYSINKQQVEYRRTPEWKRVSDGSFEALEKMCDKTASDPNSTLFHYLHGTESNIGAAKESVFVQDWPQQIKCVHKLFDDFEVRKDQYIECESPLKGVNITNLDDIEAPSKLWENSIIGDIQTSPVKMIGLLRPSTIIEECIDVSDTSNSSSQISFKSAFKEHPTEASSSCYESAHDGIKDVYKETLAINLDATLDNFSDSMKSSKLDELSAYRKLFVDIQKVEDCGSKSASVIEILSDDESSEKNIGNAISEEELNHSAIKHLDEAYNKTPNFNDTIEEVEYMMRKGMEYIAAEKVKQVEILENSKTTQKIGISFAKPKTPVRRYAVDIPVMPKLDVFKKGIQFGVPSNINIRQNNQFLHVVSPVGTYMKKTATTPLMSVLKTKNKNIFDSPSLRDLEKESRFCKSNFESGSITNTISVNCIKPTGSAVHRNLPKKAYISSQFKHIVDERTPITIPGGKTMQKYIESAMLPAVVRHDGKVTLVDDGVKQQSTRRTETSLADLSVMSGNVSLYTIKDAKQF